MDKFKGFRLVMLLALPLVFLSAFKSSTHSSSGRIEKQSNHPQKLAEWTIMIFMNGDNNLEPDAVTDFLEMAQIGSSEKVNIIVQMDLIGKYQNIGWTQTLRFRITKGMVPLPENAIKDIGEANMGDPDVLSDYTSWSMQQFPAKKYALIIWDHGQGYRFIAANAQLTSEANSIVWSITKNKNLTTEKISPLNVHVVVGDPFRSTSQSPFKSCSNDETNNDELYNREIQNGLTKSLNGQKLDVLGFDACLMAMIETGYALRTVSANFIGSEDLEPGTGWQYNDWLKKLQADPSMNGETLGKTLVKSYSATYGPFSAQTLSATNLVGFENVAIKISAFANTLKSNLTTELNNIRAARKACANYAPNPYYESPPKDYFFHVDFVRFCDQIIVRTQNTQLKNDAASARSAVLSTILATYKGSLRAGSFGSNGLAIYFPESNSHYIGDVFEQGGYTKNNTFFPVEFVQKHTWADFLHSYFSMVP